MSWSLALIAVPTLCYGAASVSYGIQGNWPLSIVYSGYAWANVGLLWLDRLSKSN
jgi:hypothetical protein